MSIEISCFEGKKTAWPDADTRVVTIHCWTRWFSFHFLRENASPDGKTTCHYARLKRSLDLCFSFIAINNVPTTRLVWGLICRDRQAILPQSGVNVSHAWGDNLPMLLIEESGDSVHENNLDIQASVCCCPNHWTFAAGFSQGKCCGSQHRKHTQKLPTAREQHNKVPKSTTFHCQLFSFARSWRERNQVRAQTKQTGVWSLNKTQDEKLFVWNQTLQVECFQLNTLCSCFSRWVSSFALFNKAMCSTSANIWGEERRNAQK